MSTPDTPPFGFFVVDDEDRVATDLEIMLAGHGLPVRKWPSCEACLQALDWDSCGVIFIDHWIPSDHPVMQGTDLLDRLVAWRSPLVVVIMSGRPGSEKVLVEEAFRLGMNNRGHCIAYLHKPLLDGSVTPIADRALAYAARWGNRKQRERLMIQALLERITPAELFVMEGVLKGLTSSDIAAAHWAYRQRNPAAPRVAKKRAAPATAPGKSLQDIWPARPGLPAPPPGEAASHVDDDEDVDDTDGDDLDSSAGVAGDPRDIYIRKRSRVVDFQRHCINNSEDRLRPLGLRIDDFDVLLDERFGSLRVLLEAEIDMRLNLLTPPQRNALEAARPHGNKAAPSTALTEALHRIRAADVKTFNKWLPKIEHLREREWVWHDGTATAAARPGTDPA